MMAEKDKESKGHLIIMPIIINRKQWIEFQVYDHNLPGSLYHSSCGFVIPPSLG